MKKIVILCMFLFSVLFASTKANAIDLSAKYACLMDAQTGEVLYEKNADNTHSMASTTKIMTALLALEHTNPKDIVTVTANAAGTEGSSIYLKAGEKIPMEDLLYGLMLESGNDAAIAVAEHVAGSVEKFAEMMTARAKEIGAKNTAFLNPNGLDAEGHYTTAYDLALIAKEALGNETFREIVSAKRKTTGKDGGTVRYFYNHNKLLSLYPGCIGVKTGYTKKTGRCLVSAAERDHVTLISVTLSAPNDWNDHKKLLDYGFDTITAKPLIMKDMILKSIPVKSGTVASVALAANEDFYITQRGKEEFSKYSLDYKLPASIPAPIEAGTKVGSVRICYDKKPLTELSLHTTENVEYKEPEKLKITDYFANFFRFFVEIL